MNTLTNLIPDLYSALDTVSRELTGYIPAVARNSRAERAAVGYPVTYGITPAGNRSPIVPAMTVPEPTGQNIGSDSVVITRSESAEFGWVGEEERGLNYGAGALTIQADQIAQAMRSLVNEIELDLALAASLGASRAVGAAGTIPFASDVGAVSQSRKVLVDNGAPTSGLQLVVNTDAGANIRTLYGINADRDFSSQPVDRQGVLVTPHGMTIRETGQPVHKAAGTVTDTTVTGVNAVGATTINVTTLITTGEVALTAGDVITIAGDSNMYVVAENATIGANTTGNIVIQEPGLRKATAGTEDVETISDFAANVAFYRNAIQLVTRAPALPSTGDMAIDSMMITDPRSGLTFEARVYPGYHKVRFELGMAWGVKVTQPRHTALLLG